MSRRRMRDWLTEDALDRDTLVTCPACKGSGNRIDEQADGKYTVSTCAWCDGLTGVPREIHGYYLRWERIKTRNRLAGRCP